MNASITDSTSHRPDFFENIIKTSAAPLLRAEAFHRLSTIYLESGNLAKARECVTQAIAFNRLVYGKSSTEFKEAMLLAKKISVELDKCSPPKRKRRRKAIEDQVDC